MEGEGMQDNGQQGAGPQQPPQPQNQPVQPQQLQEVNGLQPPGGNIPQPAVVVQQLQNPLPGQQGAGEQRPEVNNEEGRNDDDRHADFGFEVLENDQNINKNDQDQWYRCNSAGEVLEKLKAGASVKTGDFVSNILNASENIKKQFQDFIQKDNIMLIATKKRIIPYFFDGKSNSFFSKKELYALFSTKEIAMQGNENDANNLKERKKVLEEI